MDPLSKVVASGATLNRLAQQLSAQKILLRQIRQLLPPPLDSQLKAAVLRQGCLTLFLSSPVWASRFRYLLPGLQKQLVNRGLHLEKVRTGILPNEPPRQQKIKKPDPPRLSQSASQQILETAKTIADPSLQAALERLGRHAEQA